MLGLPVVARFRLRPTPHCPGGEWGEVWARSLERKEHNMNAQQNNPLDYMAKVTHYAIRRSDFATVLWWSNGDVSEMGTDGKERQLPDNTQWNAIEYYELVAK